MGAIATLLLADILAYHEITFEDMIFTGGLLALCVLGGDFAWIFMLGVVFLFVVTELVH